MLPVVVLPWCDAILLLVEVRAGVLCRLQECREGRPTLVVLPENNAYPCQGAFLACACACGVTMGGGHACVTQRTACVCLLGASSSGMARQCLTEIVSHQYRCTRRLVDPRRQPRKCGCYVSVGGRHGLAHARPDSRNGQEQCRLHARCSVVQKNVAVMGMLIQSILYIGL